MKFAFIAVEKAAFLVGLLCRTLGVSRAGLMRGRGVPRRRGPWPTTAWGSRWPPCHAESRKRYGSPRLHAELGTRGCRTSRKRVALLMRERGLAARRRRLFRVTTDSQHPFPVAPNVLAREFEQPAPNVAWVTDITYIPTGDGWLYLAVILDL